MSQTVTCSKCGATTQRVDGRIFEPWQWRYSHSYGNRFLPARDWERLFFCSAACVEPYDQEAAGTGCA